MEEFDKLEQHFRVLGLPPGARLDEVEQAYRELAASWHPDRLPDVPGLKESARKKRKEIEAAATALRDWHARALDNSAGGLWVSRASLFEDIFSNASKSARRPAWILGGALLLLALILGFALPWGKSPSATPLPDPSPAQPIPVDAAGSAPAESSETPAEAAAAGNPGIAPADAPALEEIEPPLKTSPPPAPRQGSKPRLIRKN